MLVATITPTSPSSRIIVQGIINVSENSDSCNHGVLCIFKDDGPGALACFSTLTTGINPYMATPFWYDETSGGTSTRNYSVRIGCDAANAIGYNNQRSTALIYGGALRSTLNLIEVE